MTTPKRSAIVSGARLAAGQPLFERVVGLALLCLSFAGTMALLQGGWVLPLDPIGLAAGFLVQLLLTAVEWMYQGRRRSWQYVGAVTADSALSLGGYAPLLLAPLLRVLPFDGLNGYLAWGIIAVAAVVLAVLPETILVD